MAKVKMLNDPSLRKSARPVSPGELSSLSELTEEMTKTMKAYEGMGLAANQIGDERDVFVIDVGNGPEFFLNARITEQSNPTKYEEGCLSIPGITHETTRFNSIKLKYMKLDGSEHEQAFEGTEAIAIQHEVDHLAGKLYIDQLKPSERVYVQYVHKEFRKRNRF